MIKPWFRTEEKLLLCSSYLPLGVPNWSVIYISTSAINPRSNSAIGEQAWQMSAKPAPPLLAVSSHGRMPDRQNERCTRPSHSTSNGSDPHHRSSEPLPPRSKDGKLDHHVYRELLGNVTNPQRVCKLLLYESLTPEPPTYFGYYR
jgi:hypothetical protein